MGEIGYWPIRTPRRAPLEKFIQFVSLDLTAATFQAEIRTQPEAAGAALAAIAVTIVDIQTTTWQDWVNICPRQRAHLVPCHVAMDAQIKVSNIKLAAARAVIEALPTAADARANAVFYWDLKKLTPAEDVLLAGTFEVIPGVSR